MLKAFIFLKIGSDDGNSLKVLASDIVLCQVKTYAVISLMTVAATPQDKLKGWLKSTSLVKFGK